MVDSDSGVRRVWKLYSSIEKGKLVFVQGWRVDLPGDPPCPVVLYPHHSDPTAWEVVHGVDVVSRWHDSLETARAAVIAELRDRYESEIQKVKSAGVL